MPKVFGFGGRFKLVVYEVTPCPRQRGLLSEANTPKTSVEVKQCLKLAIHLHACPDFCRDPATREMRGLSCLVFVKDYEVMFRNGQIVIIGAGPTGLGAAHRLVEIGYEDWLLYEKNKQAGGLSGSYVDTHGFTWDLGGHVLFSHYTYFDKLMDSLELKWMFHERCAAVRLSGCFVPYPFQNNIHHLPKTVMWECLKGLLAIQANHAAKPKNFEEWILATFGEGIAKYFMIPYNFKVWAYPPRQLDYQWISAYVSKVDVEKILHNLIFGEDDVSFGVNKQFCYPLHGGTGEIWSTLASKLPQDKLLFCKAVASVDARGKKILFTDGTADSYDILISTMPLDVLVQNSNLHYLKPEATKLIYSSAHIIGLGIKGSPPEKIASMSWIYFPEDNCPFYRATVFSNYSPYNVPDSSQYWSLMCEVSESPMRPVDGDAITEEVIAGAKNCELIEDEHAIVSVWHRKLDYSYPTVFLDRDKIVDPLLRALEEANIYSRGRFGAWKYEVSSQDHSLMQGVECVNRLFFKTPEITIHHPDIINNRKHKF